MLYYHCFALDYAIRKVQEKQLGLNLNGTNHLPANADDVNLLGCNMDAISKNTNSVELSTTREATSCGATR
jgi:hypothetical protein